MTVAKEFKLEDCSALCLLQHDHAAAENVCMLRLHYGPLYKKKERERERERERKREGERERERAKAKERARTRADK